MSLAPGVVLVSVSSRIKCIHKEDIPGTAISGSRRTGSRWKIRSPMPSLCQLTEAESWGGMRPHWDMRTIHHAVPALPPLFNSAGWLHNSPQRQGQFSWGQTTWQSSLGYRAMVFILITLKSLEACWFRGSPHCPNGMSAVRTMFCSTEFKSFN